MKKLKYKFPPEDNLSFLIPSAYAGEFFADQIWRNSLYSFSCQDGILYGYTDWRILDFSVNPVAVKGFKIAMDVNGLKNPNTWGEDLFMLGVNLKGQVMDITCDMVNTECPEIMDTFLTISICENFYN